MQSVYTGRQGEQRFEKDLVSMLKAAGWENEVINNPTEEDLIENWRNILFENNKSRLNDVPLSADEMNQIMEQVRTSCSLPVNANKFINGKTVPVKRDIDSKDNENAGKEVYLDIFDPIEIAGGKTRYQIVEQPVFKTPKDFNNRRGDIMLLINGMPVIHVELKASGVSLDEATSQIQKYAQESVFTGLFCLIQVFFAITPEDAVYFANPGESSRYNSAFFFHWGDEKNDPIRDWKELVSGRNSILSIPEAHKLIAYYTIANKDTDILMVLRSYQCHAIEAILQRVEKQKWGNRSPLGGFVWCTTGGGKTLTSIKAGQLIVDKGKADKVIFVMDRIDLSYQSLKEYRAVQRDGESVQETTSARDLFIKLKSKKIDDALIVTSIQKLSKLCDYDGESRKSDIASIVDKRIVFIVDEAHRSQFGEMHEKVKSMFVNALFIGFTGTPIFDENNKDGLTTESVFGSLLAAYPISDGIKDLNVLGFDPRAIKTFKDNDLRKSVALKKCSAHDEDEIIKPGNEERYRVYREYMSKSMIEIEKELPASQYNSYEHRNTVVEDILDNWSILSVGEKGTKFHAILATSSIAEACAYYKLLKSKECGLKFTAIFNPHIDNNPDGLERENDLIEIVNDYNALYGQHFDRKIDPGLKLFKKDVISRLSHKGEYKRISVKGDNDTLDLVIVVDQLLTGFDSKFVNTLYLDKLLDSDALIQAISRTNRVYNKFEKPFGIFRFYRKPYTMRSNLTEALRLYCEGGESGVEVKSLKENIKVANSTFETIERIFERENIHGFCRLPKDSEDRQKFKKEFASLKLLMNSMKLQGFKWEADCDACPDKDTCPDTENCYYKLDYSKDIYEVLEMRFSDLSERSTRGPGTGSFGFDLDSDKSEMDMEKIDSDYLEKHFRKIIPIIMSHNILEIEKDNAIKDFETELPKLKESHQEYARRIISDIRNSVLAFDENKTLRVYIQEYIERDQNKKIADEVALFGLNEVLLHEILATSRNDREMRANGRFETLLSSADIEKVKAYFNESSSFRAKSKLHDQVVSFVKDFCKFE